MGRAIGNHQLIEAGDRILVAMSGGKDSYAMCVLLRRAPGPRARCLRSDRRPPGSGAAGLRRRAARALARSGGIPYKILHEDTYSIVTDKIPEGKTYCSLCSRLRRGILYRAAAELGCNKIALGHHRDDALETLLLNLFFAGKLASMPPQADQRRRPLRRHPAARLRGGERPRRVRRRARASRSCRATCAARRTRRSASR